MGDAAVYDLAAVVAERDALRKDLDAALTECKLLTHKVITCGVAASHPDASLAHTGVYKGKWDSPQAEEVRKLRAERDALKAEVAQADAEYQDAITLAQSNKDRLDVALAEVARLSAACAAKDAALSKALGYVDLDNDALISKCLAALKGTAGTGWIDATGAVEGKIELALDREGSPEHAYVICFPPYDWSGRTVLVMVKP